MIPEPSAPAPLTTRQAEVYATITRYHEATGEGCGCRYVARKLAIHHEAVRSHFSALYRKGWLRSPTSPAVPARTFDRR